MELNVKKSRILAYKRENRKIERIFGINNHCMTGNTNEGSFLTDFLVLAPIMNVFVLWILANAIKKGIRHLYFLSRDGYPAFIVASRYCKEWNLDVECHYLYCSRFALRMPMYSYDVKEAIEYICGRGMHVTWEKIFGRAGMNKTEMRSVLDNFIENIDTEKELLYSELRDAKKLLENSKEFVELLINKSKKEWDMLYGYFKQEGLFSSDEIAIVDSGWIGTIQKSICDIRRRGGCSSDLVGFYFGLYDIPLRSDMKTYQSFFFTPKKGLLNKVFFSNCFYETVFSDSCGITMRYEKEGTNFVPVLAGTNISNEKKISDINEELIKYADLVINNMESDKLTDIQFDKLKKVIGKMIKMITWNPTMEEVNYYGTLVFSDGLLDEEKQELARLLSKRELRSNHLFTKIYTFLGSLKDNVTESAWYEGSAVRSGDLFRIHRINYLLYKMFVNIKFLFRGMK